MAATSNLELLLVDLSSNDRVSTAKLMRQIELIQQAQLNLSCLACMEHGFFYLINHGMEDALLHQVFNESKKFFSLSLHEKMKLERNKDYRGYTPLYAEKLDPFPTFKGDPKEGFNIGSHGQLQIDKNQWPPQEVLPSWRVIMESYYEKILDVSESLMSLIALALDLDDQFFKKIGALDSPTIFLRLLHYPGYDTGTLCSAHSNYGMVTLLATDGVPGLQICRDKNQQPQLWEDVHHVKGAFVVNVGDMMERWTNCWFRSTLHRVLAVGQERYSVAFFLNPNSDCLVQCLESCCSETNPPRFPPILSGDYLFGKLKVTLLDK